MKARLPLLGAGALLIVAGLVACSGESGACYGFSSILSRTYCYNGWDREECAAYNTSGVNGANWTLAAGRTCEDLGYAVSG